MNNIFYTKHTAVHRLVISRACHVFDAGIAEARGHFTLQRNVVYLPCRVMWQYNVAVPHVRMPRFSSRIAEARGYLTWQCNVVYTPCRAM